MVFVAFGMYSLVPGISASIWSPPTSSFPSVTVSHPPMVFRTDVINWMERLIQLGAEKQHVPLCSSSFHPSHRYLSAGSAHWCGSLLETPELMNRKFGAGLGMRRGEREELLVMPQVSPLLGVCSFGDHLPAGLLACSSPKAMWTMSSNDKDTIWELCLGLR